MESVASIACLTLRVVCWVTSRTICYLSNARLTVCLRNQSSRTCCAGYTETRWNIKGTSGTWRYLITSKTLLCCCVKCITSITNFALWEICRV